MVVSGVPFLFSITALIAGLDGPLGGLERRAATCSLYAVPLTLGAILVVLCLDRELDRDFRAADVPVLLPPVS